MDKQAKLISTIRPQEKDLASIPGAEPSSRIEAGWWLLGGVIALLVFLVWQVPDPYRGVFNFVLDGLWVTVYITLISFILTLFAGMIGGLGRLSKNRIVNGLATMYVELVRGIPLMVQLIWWFYAFTAILKEIGRTYNIAALSDYQASPNGWAIFGLTFCYGAYMSEIYRAGIQSIPNGQMEAARSLGMNYFQAMRYIILPQAVRVILPPVGNEFIALLKDSSLISMVAVADLTRRGREYMSSHFNPIETWILVALVYLIMTLFSSRIVNWIERRTRSEQR